MPTTALLEQIKQALRPLADPVAAIAMRAYLRDQFNFLGIAAPRRRQALQSLPLQKWTAASLLALAEALWQQPEREYRYVAIDLLRRHVKQLSLTDLPALQALIERQPWWETVDGLAGVIGRIVLQARATQPDAQLAMDAWCRHDCLWVRRVAMLHQLGWRLATDEVRLFAYAEALAPESDFFMRKAIGWALRDYGKWQPAAVLAFIERQQERLSPLSRREAGKHLCR